MKMSISWHQQCLDNLKHALQKKEEELKQLESEIKIRKANVNFYSSQITEAVRQGKDGFDRDKFRKVKVTSND